MSAGLVNGTGGSLASPLVGDDIEAGQNMRRVKDVHRALGLWSIRRALTAAFAAAAILLIAAWFFVSWLLGSPPKASPSPLDTSAQLDLLKLVFALVAGIGAVVALVTGYRRQRVEEAAAERAERAQAHAERVARDNAHDATERRVTELYGQAVEQLGHDKAAVRLGGLYSLERLAQDHPQHRQTVTDVICAYLRMPFHVPPADDDAEPAATSAGGQELEVRLAAQRLLRRHLTRTTGDHAHPSHYWDGLRIDLTGAHLIDFDFRRCRPTEANFTKTHFRGTAGFGEARFDGDAEFLGAQFCGSAGFEGVEFCGGAWFRGAQFGGDAGFDEAQFRWDAGFHGTRFKGNARFDRAQFNGIAWFHGAKFNEDAGFREARFHGDAGFGEVHFDGNVGFGEARFNEAAQFNGARFNRIAGFRGARFNGTVRFDDAQFDQEPRFTDATVGHPNDPHVWPEPWYARVITPQAAQLVRRDIGGIDRQGDDRYTLADGDD